MRKFIGRSVATAALAAATVLPLAGDGFGHPAGAGRIVQG